MTDEQNTAPEQPETAPAAEPTSPVEQPDVTVSAVGVSAEGTIPLVVLPRATVERLVILATEVEGNIPGHTGRSIESLGRELRQLLTAALKGEG